MFSFFKKSDPLAKMTKLRDRAERLGLLYLEGHAIKGTITRRMVMIVAESLNINVRELIDMIPDRRHLARYDQAMAGLRKAELAGAHQRFERDDD